MEKELDKQKLITEIDKAFCDKKDSVTVAYKVLKNFCEEGYSSKQLEVALGNYMLELRKKGEEEKEDFIMECMDFLAGWCASDFNLKNK